MSITAKEGWLKDKDGNLLSPYSLVDQVKFPEDGSSIRGKIEGAVQSSDVADSITTAIAGGASVVPSGAVVSELQNVILKYPIRNKILSLTTDANGFINLGSNMSTATSVLLSAQTTTIYNGSGVCLDITIYNNNYWLQARTFSGSQYQTVKNATISVYMFYVENLAS